jgi:uncharacterized protein (TIGR02757 family)
VTSILGFLDGLRSAFPDPSSPSAYLRECSPGDLQERFGGMRYRFYDGRSVVHLLSGIGGLLRDYGSLKEAFIGDGSSRFRGDVQAGLAAFVSRLEGAADAAAGRVYAGRRVLPVPAAGSACKRLHLFLRWMVRKDEVDPGCWSDAVSPAGLLVPVDTHMLRISRRLGFTARAGADLKTAYEITKSFRRFAFDDPVRYDFSITRIGILGEGVQWPVLSSA